MSEPVLLVDKEDGIATVTLNRPKAMNALSTALRNALAEAFEGLKNDPTVGVVIFTGAGRAFCAGLDLKELAAGGGMLEGSIEERKPMADITGPLKAFDRPIIGAINGVAITGGFEFALACDILIASTEARFADTHARVGIIPGSALSQKLSRTIGIYRAKEISLTGNFIDARQALDWGLVNRVVRPEELLPACRALAQDILSCPRDMVQKYKNLIDEGFHMTLADGLELERKASTKHFQSLQANTIATRREGIQKRGRTQQK